MMCIVFVLFFLSYASTPEFWSLSCDWILGDEEMWDDNALKVELHQVQHLNIRWDESFPGLFAKSGTATVKTANTTIYSILNNNEFDQKFIGPTKAVALPHPTLFFNCIDFRR